jgi:hypothetical protein
MEVYLLMVEAVALVVLLKRQVLTLLDRQVGQGLLQQ